MQETWRAFHEMATTILGTRVGNDVLYMTWITSQAKLQQHISGEYKYCTFSYKDGELGVSTLDIMKNSKFNY